MINRSKITDGVIEKLNKANARDVASARMMLRHYGDARYYAASLSCIHRSSSSAQQFEIEHAIVNDSMQHLFGRHPVNGCMLSAVES